MGIHECKLEGCPNQFVDGLLRSHIYCKGHRHLEGTRAAKRYIQQLNGTEPEGKTVTLAQRESLKEALDRATYALEFIIQKGCDCKSLAVNSAPNLSIIHDPLCHVLAAQNGLDNIKAAMGDTE